MFVDAFLALGTWCLALGVCAAQPCVPPPSGLVAWWRAENNFNDAAGTNHGTPHSEPGFVPGRVGTAFSFNGIATQVEVADSPSFQSAAGITLEAWILTPGTADYSGIIHKFGQAGGVASGFELSMHTGGRVRADFGGGLNGYLNVVHPAVVTDGNWHHLVATYDGAVAWLYVDGVPGPPEFGTNFFTGNTRTLSLGFDDYQFNTGHNRVLNGNIDEASVYNRGLNAAEVQGLFQAGAGGKCLPCVRQTRGVLALWKAEGDAMDSARTNHGTLQNSASFGVGRAGQAFAFNGGDGFVSVADSPAWKFGTNDFTIELWTKFNQVKSSMFIHQETVGDASGFEFYWEAFNNQLFFSDDSSHVSIVRPWVTHGVFTLPLPNFWYHLAVTRTRGNYRLYVDGQQSGSEQPDANPVGDVHGQLRIGNYAFPGYALNGFIDELTIYNRALTTAELEAIYNAGSAGKCLHSVDWFKVAGGGGSSTDGSRTIVGTAGQADASNPLTNSQYSLVGGFWAMPVAVQAPGAPMLTIVPAAPGFATISWTSATPGYHLQVSTSLNPPNWTNAPSGATNPITVPATPPANFYRLTKP